MNKKTFKAFKFYEETWKANITFCVGPLNELKKYWDKRLKDNIDFSMYNDADGSAAKLKGNNTEYRFLWIDNFKKNDPCSHGILAHEISHLAIQILEDKGLSVRHENEEAIAYLIDRLTRHFYKTI